MVGRSLSTKWSHSIGWKQQLSARVPHLILLARAVLATTMLVAFVSCAPNINSNVPILPKETLVSKAQPTPDTRYLNLKQEFDAQESRDVLVRTTLEKRLGEWEEFVSKIVKQGNSSTEDWIAPDCRATSVNRSEFVNTFPGNRVRVARWRPGREVPKFSGRQAVGKSMLTCLQPWIACSDFFIEIQLFKIRIDANICTADLLVEVYGLPDTSMGRGATALWQTEWRIGSIIDDLKLIKLVVRGQEELVNYTPGGRLLADSTAWILNDCPCYKDDLAFGLDHWARRIPGLDISGNNGLAVCDINHDGLDDIYVCQPHGMPNLLFFQNPDGSVDEVGETLAVNILDDSRAALFVDLDNDRRQDLVISTDEAVILMSQKRDGRFQLEHRLTIGRDGGHLSTADFDQDGDLDLFVCKYFPIEKSDEVLAGVESVANSQNGGRNILFRNDEAWKFVDATEQVGLGRDNLLNSRSAVWCDFDLDGDQDLYVTNEFNRDTLFENQNGWFSDVTESKKMVRRARHRSVSVGEFNQDGKPDLFVSSNVPLETFRSIGKVETAELKETAAALQSNSLIWFSRKRNQYRSYTFPAPIFSAQSVNGSAVADLNNDTNDDLLLTNGGITRTRGNFDEMAIRKLFEGTNSTSEIGFPQAVKEGKPTIG